MDCAKFLTKFFLDTFRLLFIETRKIPEQIFGMLLYTPKYKAVQSIRLAMTHLLQANRGFLAQRLVNELEAPVCDISASRFYPSWCSRLDPYQVMNRETFGRNALRAAARHMWDACLDFEEAGMRRAAYVCLQFSAQIVVDELLTIRD